MKTRLQEMNKEIEDLTCGRRVLINTCTREGLINFPEMKEQYNSEYPGYEPHPLTIKALKPLIKDKTFVIVLGTWCGDSKLQVPHFFQILDSLSITEKDFTIICVDGTKRAENGLLDKMAIERVPTFIFYKDDKEVGRIVESPYISLEKDMLTIFLEEKI